MVGRTIVVGVEDCLSARNALRWAAELARETCSPLVGLHVLPWPPAGDLYGYSVLAEELYPDPPLGDSVYRAPSEEVFAEVDPEPGWTLAFAQGHAGHLLVEQSRDAGMLVLGAPEHTGVLRLLNSSVAHYCLSHAQCPVVTVPCAATKHRSPAGGSSGREGATTA
jgi:nucleotide-binding universal stress UspA family protein